jgi:hypothetical protein
MRVGGVFALAAALGAAGCTLAQLDTLVPQSAVSDIGSLPGTIRLCSTSSAARTALANKQAYRLATIHSNVTRVKAALPTQLAADPVVGSVIDHVRYVSTNAIVKSRMLLNSGQITETDAAFLAAAPKARPILHTDMLAFTHTVAEIGLRNTGNQVGTGDPGQQFWDHLKAYYTLYFQGQFTNYFAVTITKPSAQLTIGDQEIVQAAGIFLELIFDEILSPTVWKGSDNKYYPGAGTAAPSYLSVFAQQTENLQTPDFACGMTAVKAATLMYLAKTFSTAASAETSVTVKSFGGIEVGLGIFGKLSIGDNSTLTMLLQSVVTEAVQRLTIAIGAPILEAIEIVNPPAVMPRSAQSRARLIQLYSAPFVSAGGV